MSMSSAKTSATIRSVVMGAGGLFVLLALVSFEPTDLSLLSSEANQPARNIGGLVGAWIGFLGRGGFGWASLVLPLVLGLWAVRTWTGQLGQGRWISRSIACVGLMVAVGTLFALGWADPVVQTLGGGAVGYLVVRAGGHYLGSVGTALLAGCVVCLSWFLIADYTPRFRGVRWLLARLQESVGRVVQTWRHRRDEPSTPSQSVVSRPRVAQAATPEEPRPSRAGSVTQEPPAMRERPPARVRPAVGSKPAAVASLPRSRQVADGFQLPPLDLLSNAPAPARERTDDSQAGARVLEEALREFGIEATVVNVDRGPTVTRYELQPAPGVKLTRITALSDDLALVLKAVSCHITAPIPGKGLVGIDVPNSTMAIVSVKDILTSREFAQLSSPLALAIGKDVSGKPLVADLRECPHLLVAGATGSGKTVCLNSLLTAILYHASPDDVKFLMIDPKKVELVLFNDIPHLVSPVVTDAKRAAAALNWAVQEMERRYQLLAKRGARNIDIYNQKAKATGTFAASEATEEQAERMPYLVIVIDELADLMMVASQGVEEAITRLSQLSRAVGLHMIIATQRPSVDVITGVIKANFPARIAFQVSAKVDSRTILDANGADKLLGRGDMLFLQPGRAKPLRAQSCFVTDAEIERIVAHLKAQRGPVYDEQLVARQAQPTGVFEAELERDELYEMAKRLVLESKHASTSLLQRRLRLGYARAARILDLMEQEGVVGPPQGSRPREVLVGEDAMESSA